jgi:hypothetical protein
LDEGRVSNHARSAAWIATGSANQVDPASFALVGPEQSVP